MKDCKENQRFEKSEEKRKTKELPVEREKIAGGLYCVFLNSTGIKVYLGIYIYSRSSTSQYSFINVNQRCVDVCVGGAIAINGEKQQQMSVSNVTSTESNLLVADGQNKKEKGEKKKIRRAVD